MMIMMTGRIYIDEKIGGYKKNEKGSSFIFQLGLPNANSKNDGNGMTFIDCIAFSTKAQAESGKGTAEILNKYYGDAKKGGAQRGKPLTVFGRMQDRKFDRTVTQKVRIDGEVYEVDLKVPQTTKQLVVDSVQSVPQWDGKDTPNESKSKDNGVKEVRKVEVVEDGEDVQTVNNNKKVEEVKDTGKKEEPVLSNGDSVDREDPFENAGVEQDPFA